MPLLVFLSVGLCMPVALAEQGAAEEEGVPSLVVARQAASSGNACACNSSYIAGGAGAGSDLAARALAAELARASEVGGDLARSVLPALAGVEGRLERLLRA